MDNLIRTDTVFGKRVNIVGNISADLVLESLGKVYIKSRNKSLTLEEVIKSLAGEDPNISTSRVKVVEGIEGLDTTGLKDGTFIFDKLSSILYLFIDGELLELINVAPDGESYVKRSGDTMTGRLAIYVKNGPPLYVNSSTLVENLNAQYLNGETAETFTRRNKDEKIEGRWTFKNPTTFSANTLFYKDIIANGSVGSPSFAGGFGGYGWRMDASTNTLTIDNLVVRKLMQVYELVVNKISATNGSLWITNAGKVVFALKLEIKDSSFFTSGDAYERFCLTLKLGDYFIKLPGTVQTRTDIIKTASGDSTIEKTYWDATTLENTKLIKALSTESYVGKDFSGDLDSSYRVTSLFSSDFKFNCTFPIVTRSDYRRYILNIESLNLDINSYITIIYSYYKYFAGGDFYVVAFDDDELPVFKPGDILRCLKWTYGGIKYYDAVVCNLVGNSYVILLAPSIYDNKTTITYDLSLDAHVIYGEDLPNLDLYKLSTLYREPAQDQADNINYDDDGNSYTLSYLDLLEKNLIGLVEEKDSLVLIGNLWDCQRQNAVYITSTDNGAPFMDVISGVNRPDYSVIYYIPIYKTVKLNACPIPTNPFNGYTGLVNVPYTGNYYIQKNANCEYIYFEYNNVNYFASSTVPLPGNVNVLYYLNTYPDTNTAIGDAKESYNILTENGECIITEGSDNRPEEYIILEEEKTLLQVLSTKTTKARLGNLDGILDEIFPTDRLPYGYGLYGLNVFLTGEFYLNNGQSVADIGKDSISFAIASQNAIYSSMEILKQDLQKADNLLKQKVYTKGDLLSAGMRMGYDSDGNPGIVMWGNKIVMATTLSEFIGRSLSTALFANGRIAAKFISVNNIHSALGFGETIPIYLKKYTYNNDLEYYKEHQIFSRTDENNNTTYYYVDDTGTEQPCENSLLMGNTLYGWNLEATGEGYLARGNISWEENGNLNIDGNIHLRKILLEGDDTNFNGIYVYGSNNLTALVINGQELKKLEDANSTSYFRLYIDWTKTNNSPTTPLTIYDPILEKNLEEQLAKLCEILFSGNKNIKVTINIPQFTEFTYIGPLQYINIAHEYPLIAAFYYIEKDEENSTITSTLVSCQYILNNEAFLSSGDDNTDAEYNYLVLYINPGLYGAMKGFIGVRTAILISLIGRNFMSITPNVDSLMWVGLDKFGVYYRRKTRMLGSGIGLSRAVLYGLEVDSYGIYIHYNGLGESSLTSLDYKGTILDSIDTSDRYDLISYIDGGHGIVSGNNAGIVLDRFLNRNITVYSDLTVSGVFISESPQIGLIFTFIGATTVKLTFTGIKVLRSKIILSGSTLAESNDEEITEYQLRFNGIIRLMYIGTTQVVENEQSISRSTFRIIL